MGIGEEIRVWCRNWDLRDLWEPSGDGRIVNLFFGEKVNSGYFQKVFMDGKPLLNRVFAYLCCAAVLVCVPAVFPATADEPLFAPHSTVVLLAGLAGDVESETTYREQMQSWLDLVERSSQVENVCILCDGAETLKLPTRIRSTVLA